MRVTVQRWVHAFNSTLICLNVTATSLSFPPTTTTPYTTSAGLMVCLPIVLVPIGQAYRSISYYSLCVLCASVSVCLSNINIINYCALVCKCKVSKNVSVSFSSEGLGLISVSSRSHLGVISVSGFKVSFTSLAVNMISQYGRLISIYSLEIVKRLNDKLRRDYRHSR